MTREPHEMTVRLASSPFPACEWFRDRKIQAWYVRWVAGRTLLDETLPVIARGNAWSALPLERIGDAFLSIVHDWPSFPPRSGVTLAIRLEQLNAEIMEADRQKIEGPAPALNEEPARPTRKGKHKRKPKSGRR